MLYHLNEPDYKNETPNDIVTRFYGRTPQQILTSLDYYNGRVKEEGRENAEDLVWWLKRKFTNEDISQTQKGIFYFFTGMILFTEENKKKPLFEEIKITDDFSVYVPQENIGNFALWRQNVMEKERGGLYKLRNPIEAFSNLSFVPEDIARSIINYDLTPYRGVVENDMVQRRELSKNPQIKVDGLQKILEGQTKTFTLSNDN